MEINKESRTHKDGNEDMQIQAKGSWKGYSIDIGHSPEGHRMRRILGLLDSFWILIRKVGVDLLSRLVVMFKKDSLRLVLRADKQSLSYQLMNVYNRVLSVETCRGLPVLNESEHGFQGLVIALLKLNESVRQANEHEVTFNTLKDLNSIQLMVLYRKLIELVPFREEVRSYGDYTPGINSYYREALTGVVERLEVLLVCVENQVRERNLRVYEQSNLRYETSEPTHAGGYFVLRVIEKIAHLQVKPTVLPENKEKHFHEVFQVKCDELLDIDNPNSVIYKRVAAVNLEDDDYNPIKVINKLFRELESRQLSPEVLTGSLYMLLHVSEDGSMINRLLSKKINSLGSHELTKVYRMTKNVEFQNLLYGLTLIKGGGKLSQVEEEKIKLMLYTLMVIKRESGNRLWKKDYTKVEKVEQENPQLPITADTIIFDKNKQALQKFYIWRPAFVEAFKQGLAKIS